MLDSIIPFNSLSACNQCSSSLPSGHPFLSTDSGSGLRKEFVETLASAQSLRDNSSDGERVTNGQVEVDHVSIEFRAKQIYERNGCPEGRDEEHWLQAERELKGIIESNIGGAK
jgi:hypothetical protein